MTDDRSSKRAARRLARLDGISYTAAQQRLIDAGYWGWGQRFFDELLTGHVPGQPLENAHELSSDFEQEGER